MDDLDDILAWLDAPGDKRVHIQGTCSIGRSPSNQLSLPAEKVSRRHALIHAQGNNEFWLVDLGSSNGTVLNGRRVTQPVQLRDQDRIEICEFRLLFRQRSRSQSANDSMSESRDTVHDVKSAHYCLLVADLAGSTQMLKNLSAGDLAAATGRWLAECKQIIEESGGNINKFLGDGFFAYWPEREKVALGVIRALESLKRMQAAGPPLFRVVVHHGNVFTGAGASMGEESLLGPEVNFVFRMEKLAARLGLPCLASAPASNLLVAGLPAETAGSHPLAGFDGEFPFYRF